MRTILLLILFTTSIKINAQTTNWTKDDRNNLYSDCMSYSTKYKNLSGEQKESICLCYLEETTKKYNKTDFEAKIDIEIKRIKEAMLTQCGKNIGVELNTQPKEEVVLEKKLEESKKTSSRDLLVGSWKSSDDAIINFSDDGTFLVKYNHNETFNSTRIYYMIGNTYNGDWFLDENDIITLKCNWQEDSGRWKQVINNYFGNKKLKISNISSTYLKIVDEDNTGVPIQCNKIK